MPNSRSEKLQKYADIFKALSNPNRLRIFMRIVTSCKPGTIHTVDPATCAYVGELGKDLGIVPSTVSHHIKELRQAGLIKMQRQGQKIECWVDADVFEEVKSFIMAIES